jgi:hypothetical protein
MTFKTTALVGDRVLVTGTDFLGTEGKTVLDSSQWTGIKQQRQLKSATSEFDAAVEEFFKPLTEAAEKAAKQAQPVEDPTTYVVIDEEVEGTQGRPAHLVKLTHDSIVLRLLEENAGTDRLAWVGDTLEVLASSQSASATPTAAEVAAE